MPRILPASSRTSSMDLATFTPPPLPRPPAWICALTTQTLPPIVSAALTASSTENAGMPRGVGMPKRRKISFPWYSWIFTRGLACCHSGEGRDPIFLASASTDKIGPRPSPGRRPHAPRPSPGRRAHESPDSCRASIPLGIVASHGVARRLQSVTAVELERLALAGLDLAPQAGEHLDRRGRGVHEQLGDMTAASDPAHHVAQRLAKTVQQARADELAVRRLDAVAGALVGHEIGPDFHRADDVIGAHRHPHRHVVHRDAGLAQPGEQRVVVILDVGEITLDVEQPVVATESFVDDAPRVEACPVYGRR